MNINILPVEVMSLTIFFYLKKGQVAVTIAVVKLLLRHQTATVNVLPRLERTGTEGFYFYLETF